MKTDKAILMLRAEAFGWPAVTYGNSSYHLVGEAGWKRGMPEVLPGFLPEIARQLDAVDAELHRATDFEQRMADIDTRRATAAVPDEALIAEVRAEGEAMLAQVEAERPKRVEALLERVVELLEKAAK